MVVNSKILLSVVLILFSLGNLFALEITLENVIPGPKIPGTLPSNMKGINLGFPRIAWTAKNKLIYNRAPLSWLIDREKMMVSRQVEMERLFPQLSVQVIWNHDGVVIQNGSAFEREYFYYSNNTGTVELENKSAQQLMNRREVFPGGSSNSQTVDGVFQWNRELYGPYALLPYPIFGPEVAGLSLKNTETGETIPVLDALEFYNLANYDMTAVRFDRFKFAWVGEYYQKDEGSEPDYSINIYFFSITYDGFVSETTSVRIEPDIDAPEAGALQAGESVRVTNADTFMTDENKRSDFWYFVKNQRIEGWVFGGDLLIEGEDWEKRLKSRGRPFDIEAFLAHQESNSEVEPQQDAKDEESAIITETPENRNTYSPQRNSEAFHRILIIAVLSAITLTLVIGFVGSKMKKPPGQTSDSESP
ncbi:SH3 domain-containing protein [Salinispira pacifica]|nr:SH3 domain-containing protein [Salinispira pacifica]